MLVHDFLDKELGKAIPYGVYDVGENQGRVSVGSITTRADSPRKRSVGGGRRWGRSDIATPRSVDHRGWRATAVGAARKIALQDLAVRLELPIHMCHFPPGTSKWNKIEHRMFCHITQNRAAAHL